jgi:hypothetical protein
MLAILAKQQACDVSGDAVELDDGVAVCSIQVDVGTTDSSADFVCTVGGDDCTLRSVMNSSKDSGCLATTSKKVFRTTNGIGYSKEVPHVTGLD